MLVGFFLPEVFPVTMMLSLNLKGHVRDIKKKKKEKHGFWHFCKASHEKLIIRFHI